MTKQQTTEKRLSRNFHKTFIPERHYIHAMLLFASSRRSGDYREIADATGIPMGESSGKVPAILDYCRGMGLVTLPESNSSKKEPRLTPFGRIVFLEDPHLKETITQWIAHLNLCSRLSGADVWYHTFFSQAQVLGESFTRDDLERELAFVYGTRQGRLIGPIVRTYQDDAALKTCGALAEDDNGKITRVPAPITEEFGFAYGAWIAKAIEDHFSADSQVTVSELNEKAGWQTIPAWKASEAQRVLQLIERKGVLTVDRHMEPWVLRIWASADSVFGRMYDDLI